MWYEYIGVAISMALSNFLYQAIFGKKNWEEAWERTWFQCVALTVAYIVIQ